MSSKHHLFVSRARATIIIKPPHLVFDLFVCLRRDEKHSPTGLSIWMLYPQLMGLIREGIGRCSLGGGSTSLGLGYEVLKPHATSNSFSASCFQLKMPALSFLLQSPCLLPAAMPPCCDGLLSIWNQIPI